MPHHGWCKTIEVLEEGQRQAHQVALFSEARPAPDLDQATVPVKLRELQLPRPRRWEACWLACELWGQVALEALWSDDWGVPARARVDSMSSRPGCVISGSSRAVNGGCIERGSSKARWGI
jgi:hypothetical protein